METCCDPIIIYIKRGAPILWPPDAKRQLIGKDLDPRKE